MKFLFSRHYLIIIICLWLAFLLRVWGLDFGLPYKFHPDEDKYVDAALEWYTTGETNLNLINPPLFTYILWAGDRLWFTLVPATNDDDWLTSTYFFARLWSVILAMLTICLTYKTAKHLGNTKAGIVAMILLSALFLPIREAHFAVNDSAVTFFVLLATYLCLRLFKDSSLINYELAGIAVGLAAGAKLTGGLVGLNLLVAHFLSRTKRHILLGSSLAAAAIAFLIVSGYILWQFPEFIEAVKTHFDYGASGYKGLQMAPMNGWFFYGYVLSWGAGWVMTVVIILALVSIARHPDRKMLILLVFPFALFIYMGAQKIVFARFILPAIPPLVVLVAVQLVKWEKKWSFWQKHPVINWSSIIILLIAQPLIHAVWFDHLLTLPDTRELATEWFNQEFPTNTAIAAESYSILPNTVLLDTDWPYDIKNLSTSNQMDHGAEHYLLQLYDIIILSNFTSGRVRDELSEEIVRQQQLTRLEQEATLIKEFNPYRPNYSGWFYLDELYGPAGETLQRNQPGPWLRIYKINLFNSE